MKKIIIIVVVSYLTIGTLLGLAMSLAIPAMNSRGVAYYAVTWPAWICSGTRVCKTAPPIPDWAFTFPTTYKVV